MKWINRSIKIIWTVIWVLILGTVLFSTVKRFPLVYVLFLLGCCMIYYFYLSIKCPRNQIFKRKFKIFVLSSFILLFVVQVFISHEMYFLTGWDAGTVRDIALAYYSDHEFIGNNEYLSFFPNNLFVTQTLMLAFRIASIIGISDYYFGAVILSCLCITGSGILMVGCIFEITESVTISLLGELIFIPLIGLSPWMIIPYTDSLGIIFPLLTLYLYLLSLREDLKKYRIALLFSTSVIALIGYAMKPTALIMLIAIIIYDGVIRVIQKDWNGLGIFAAIVIMAFICVNGIFINGFNHYYKVSLDENLKRPFSYFFYMGNDDECHAVWNERITNLQGDYATVQERNKANIEGIKKNLQDFGVLGYVKFLHTKTLVEFDDGTFAWWGEGGFLQEEKGCQDSVALFLKSVFYPDGKYYIHWKNIMQFIWIFVLVTNFGMLLNKSPIAHLLILCMLGVIAYFVLSEARARYLFIYAPLFVMMSVIGIQKRESNP